MQLVSVSVEYILFPETTTITTVVDKLDSQCLALWNESLSVVVLNSKIKFYKVSSASDEGGRCT